MTRKRKFIVNRNTWRLHQFEFSVPCSYQECLARLRALEADLQARYLMEVKRSRNRVANEGDRPKLKLQEDDESTAFELNWHSVMLTGTLQFITDKSTLFVGISQFKWDYPVPVPFYVIALVVGVIMIAVASLPFLFAYVSPHPERTWTDQTILSGLHSSLIPLLVAVIFYIGFRIEVTIMVNMLLRAFKDCSDK